MMTDYSNEHYMTHNMLPGHLQHQPQPTHHMMHNPACLCPECTNQRWQMREIPAPQSMNSGVPRKYTHNPYALGPTFPSAINTSTPPVVTPDDAIASIVPNVADYEVSTNPAYMSSVAHLHHQHQIAPTVMSQTTQLMNVNNSIQEQFNQSVGMIAEIACSTRGRSLLQAILRLRQPFQIKIVVDEMCVNDAMIVRLMLDGNACHVIRSLIDVMDLGHLRMVANPVVLNESHILQLATNSQHTRRILQSLFERFSHEHCCDRIASVLAHHAQYLATTQQGCIAIMRVVDHAQPSQKNMIHESLFPAMVSLASDPYGNYVIQHTIERGDTTLISNAVMNYFLGSTAHLCCNKFASNVMEKVLYNVNPATRRAVIESFISNPVTLQSVMNDGYGNFVIQATIDSCSNYQEYRRMADRMRPHIHTSPYGHKIDAKFRSKRASHSLVNGSTAVSSAASSACNTAPSTPRSTMANHGYYGNPYTTRHWLPGSEPHPDNLNQA